MCVVRNLILTIASSMKLDTRTKTLLLALLAMLASWTLVEPLQAKTPPGFVDASSFGFDPADATAALQAAIDTGSNVYVPKMSSDWIVSPIVLSNSNQEIQFESGVVVAAKPGSFLGRHEAMFSAVGQSNVKLIGYGATLRMRKRDYRQAPYAKSEWRHGISVRDVTGLVVRGLTIEGSGGDGIYIGTTSESGYCRDVVIKDVVLNDNHRQGLSVISVEKMLVDNAVILNTEGTEPQAGIDFEVNFKTQRIKDVEIRNCILYGNKTQGILFAGHSDLQAGPITVDVENVTIVSNQADGIKFYNPLPGVTIKDSLIVGNLGAGLLATWESPELLKGEAEGSSPPRNAIEHCLVWGNSKEPLFGWLKLGPGSSTDIEPKFVSTDPASPHFLYLQPDNPASVLQGDHDGGFIGARPVYTKPTTNDASRLLRNRVVASNPLSPHSIRRVRVNRNPVKPAFQLKLRKHW